MNTYYLYHIVKYILFAIICIILFFFLYIRFTFQFWYMQPVFHVYDLHYYLFPPGIIHHDLPERNKFCNFKNVETIEFSKMESYQISKFANFVQFHYLRNKDNVFLPQKNNIVPYFNNHNHPCFFSFYKENEILMDVKKNGTIEDSKIISVITSRPLKVVINNGNNDAHFDVYYVDYLCVDKRYRKNGIAPQIIQTHEYNQRMLNKKIKVSLFKREGDLTGIVPLCVFTTYGFEMATWKKPPHLHPSLGIVEVGKNNIHILIDFIKTSSNKFDILIIPEISNILELILNQNIFCYMLVENGDVLCCYFFRKQCSFIRKDVEILSCFASINNNDNLDIFERGFKICIWKIYKKNQQFQYFVIESISDNQKLIENLQIRTKSNLESPTAYFFYNFAYTTFRPSKCFIIN